MKTLVVYFSFEGNTEFIAKKIAETLHADIVALKTSKEYPKTGFRKFFWGGTSVIFGEKPELVNEHIDFSLYDTIIIGTPVWAGSYSPPISTLLNQYKIEGKKIALFACHGGGGAVKCFDKMKDKLHNNEFIGQIEFKDPLKTNTNDNSERAISWAASLSI